MNSTELPLAEFARLYPTRLGERWEEIVALAQPTAEPPAPVAWRYRYHPLGAWYLAEESAQQWSEGQGYDKFEEQPMYAAAPALLPAAADVRDALAGLMAACEREGWWLKSGVVKEMDNARAALGATCPASHEGPK